METPNTGTSSGNYLRIKASPEQAEVKAHASSAASDPRKKSYHDAKKKRVWCRK
jgi:hypothetical protein